MKYKRIELPYSFDSLEPYLDKQTVEAHYEQHHKAYQDKLNAFIEGKSFEVQFPTLDDLMKNYQKIEDKELRTKVREYGGGLINHNFLWPSLKKETILKDGNLKQELIKKWGSIDEFKKEYKALSLSLFGSGWVWLVKKNNKLKLILTFNQDNPWFLESIPIFGIDLWEHAYYLKHNSRRANYFEDMWNLINWDFAEEQFLK